MEKNQQESRNKSIFPGRKQVAMIKLQEGNFPIKDSGLLSSRGDGLVYLGNGQIGKGGISQVLGKVGIEVC